MKGTTSYNEVADELVAELTDPRYNNIKYIYIFPRQSHKRFPFRVKSCDLIFVLFGVSPIVNYYDIKSQSYQAFHVENII
jgi:hypothetical protein